MGYTSVFNPNLTSLNSIKRALKSELQWSNETSQSEIVMESFRLGRYFTVVKYTHKLDSSKSTYAGMVTLWSYDKAQGELFYKEMDETVGPDHRGYPQKFVKFLNEVAPTDSVYAVEFRRKVLEKKYYPKDGDLFKLYDSVMKAVWYNGKTRKLYGIDVNDGRQYRIRPSQYLSMTPFNGIAVEINVMD